MPVALRIVLIVLGLFVAVGVLGAITGLVRAFSAVGGESTAMDPAEKARRLGEGLSLSMNSTAFALLVATVGGLVVLGYWIVTRRRKASSGDG